jgi:hypothetical protein
MDTSEGHGGPGGGQRGLRARWRAANAPRLVALVRWRGVRERPARRTTRRIRR